MSALPAKHLPPVMHEPSANTGSTTMAHAPVDELLQTAQPPATARGWPMALATLAAVLAALVGLFWDTASSMVDTWYTLETYAHGFVILPISLYMAWTRQAELVRITPRPAWGALVLLAGAVFLWLLAELVGVQAARQFAFVAMVPLAVWAVLGTRVAWALAFPLAYLFFAVPVGEALTEPLMDHTATFTVWALQLTGIPVYSEGRYITIPSGNWEVAEACSGIRYLIASVALGSLYAYLTYRSLWRRALFIALSIAAPIVANWLRAYGIVMLGHLSDMRLAVGVDHLIYGWVFFGVVMLLMFWIGSFWREDTNEQPSHVDPPASPGAVLGTQGDAAADVLRSAKEQGEGALTATVLGLDTREQTAPRRHALAAATPAFAFVAASLMVALVAAAGPLAAREIAAREASATGVEVMLPTAAGPWSGPAPPAEAWSPTFPGSAQLLHQTYQRDGAPVQAYAVLYLRERQGEELIAWGNRLYDPKDWKVFASGRTEVALPSGARLPVEETHYSAGGARRLVWHWYDIAGYRTAIPEVAKLLGAWARLTGDRNGYALVALAAEYTGRPEDARALLTDLLTATPALASPLRREFTAEAQRR